MFLQMSITAGILIAFTFVIRFFFREKLPKMTFLILWMIVIARLLIPMSFYTDYSIQGFIDSARGDSTHEIAPEIIFFDDVPIDSEYIVNVMTSSFAIDWSTVLLIIWIVGTLITVIYFVKSYWKLRKQLRFAIPIKDNDLINKWQEQHRFSRNITILVCDQIHSPLTTGIMRPKIYLPKQMNWADLTQLEYILTHEFYHIKRLDALWKLIAVIALCLHWFNPLVWGMCVLANRDLEITCDALVVKKFGLDSKKSYAFALIGMVEKKRQLVSLHNGFARNATEERIRSIMKGNRTSIMGICFAALFIPILIFTAFAVPNEVPAEYEYGEMDEYISFLQPAYEDGEYVLPSLPIYEDIEVVSLIATEPIPSFERWSDTSSAFDYPRAELIIYYDDEYAIVRTWYSQDYFYDVEVPRSVPFSVVGWVDPEYDGPLQAGAILFHELYE